MTKAEPRTPDPKLRISAPDRRFEILAQADELVITCYGIIGNAWDDSGLMATDVAKALREHRAAKLITVNINSPGGSAFEAVTIYNALKRHKARVVVNIDGAAISAASVLAMAGDEINMAENALMMIHDPWTIAVGMAEDLRATADMLDKCKDTLVVTYAGRAAVDKDEITELMAAETWLSAEEALELGLVDRITETKAVAALGDLSRYKNMPNWVNDRLASADDPQSNQLSDQAAMTAAESNKESDMSEQKQEQTAVETPKAATVTELKAAFPESSAEFREKCLEAEATLEQARASWAEHVQAENAKLVEAQNELQTKCDELGQQVEKLEAKAKNPAEPAAGGGKAVETTASETDDGPGDESQWEAEFKRDRTIRAEFGDLETYQAFKKAEGAGRVKIRGQ